ncbi:unnamed protein product, partial [Amoebophrya sp. A25]
HCDVVLKRWREDRVAEFLWEVACLSRTQGHAHVLSPDGYFVEEVNCGTTSAGGACEQEEQDGLCRFYHLCFSYGAMDLGAGLSSFSLARSGSYNYTLRQHLQALFGTSKQGYLSTSADSGNPEDYTAGIEKCYLRQVIAIFAQIADAMRFLHSCGIVHRKICVDTIVLDEALASSGASPHAYLSDFSYSCCDMETLAGEDDLFSLMDTEPPSGEDSKSSSGWQTALCNDEKAACLLADKMFVEKKISSENVAVSDSVADYFAPEIANALAKLKSDEEQPRTSPSIFQEASSSSRCPSGEINVERARNLGQKVPWSNFSDVFSLGATFAKTLFSPTDTEGFEVRTLPRNPVSRLLEVPGQLLERFARAPLLWDALDFMQSTLQSDPGARLHHMTSSEGDLTNHPVFSYTRNVAGSVQHRPSQRVMGTETSGGRDQQASQVFESLGRLREQYRYVCSKEPLLFQREKVFKQILSSKIHEWKEDILLGEWRTLLDGESGVDGGGLRREIFHLFFEQMFAESRGRFIVSSSSIDQEQDKDPTGEEEPKWDEMHGCYIPKRPISSSTRSQKSADGCSVEDPVCRLEWKNNWVAIGLMSLRCVIHCHQIPAPLSPFVWAATFGLAPRLPPDDVTPATGPSPPFDSSLTDDARHTTARSNKAEKAIFARIAQIRRGHGDAWARQHLNCFLALLDDPEKERSYRWMFTSLVSVKDDHVVTTSERQMKKFFRRAKGVRQQYHFVLKEAGTDVFEDLLDPRAYRFLTNSATPVTLCRVENEDAQSSTWFFAYDAATEEDAARIPPAALTRARVSALRISYGL